MTRHYRPDVIPPLVSDAEWGPPTPHDGSAELPAGLAPNEVVMLAWNKPVHQTPLTWAYASRRAAPAGERDWEHATTYRVRAKAADLGLPLG